MSNEAVPGNSKTNRAKRVLIISLVVIFVVVGFVVVVGLLGRGGCVFPKEIACCVGLHDLSNSLASYAVFNKGAYPDDLDTLVRSRVVPSAKWMRCPGMSSPVGTIDYYYVKDIKQTDSRDWILVFDPPGAHPDGTRNVLYNSGRVERLKTEAFDTAYSRFSADFFAKRGVLPAVILSHMYVEKPATNAGP